MWPEWGSQSVQLWVPIRDGRDDDTPVYEPLQGTDLRFCRPSEKPATNAVVRLSDLVAGAYGYHYI